MHLAPHSLPLPLLVDLCGDGRPDFTEAPRCGVKSGGDGERRRPS